MAEKDAFGTTKNAFPRDEPEEATVATVPAVVAHDEELVVRDDERTEGRATAPVEAQGVIALPQVFSKLVVL